jgi:Protein of unknown function (DUF3168)
MIEVGFRQLLTTAAAVNAQIAGRVYFITRPQDDRRPCIVLELVSYVPAMIFGGPGGYGNGRMQITCLASDYKTAKCIAKAVRSTIDAYSGCLDTTIFGYIETEDVRDIPVVPLEGQSTPATFGVIIDAAFMAYE